MDDHTFQDRILPRLLEVHHEPLDPNVIAAFVAGTLSGAERVRMALEELGPTFVKMGQILSTRPDLLPVQFITELEKLQDHVPPFAYDQVKEIIEIEEGLNPIAMLVIGYPAELPEPTTRRRLDEIDSHLD